MLRKRRAHTSLNFSPSASAYSSSEGSDYDADHNWLHDDDTVKDREEGTPADPVPPQSRSSHPSATWKVALLLQTLVGLAAGAAVKQWVGSWVISWAWICATSRLAEVAWQQSLRLGRTLRLYLEDRHQICIEEEELKAKWDAQWFKLAAHATSALACGWVMASSSSSSSLSSSAEHWFRVPLDSDNGLGSPVFLLYSAQVVRWMQGLRAHLLFEERSRDFAVMAVHHVVTLALLLGSWVCHFHRVGIVVLLLHDVSDVFVCVMQLLHYANMQGRHRWWLAELAFVVNFAVWCYTRLWLLPVHVIGGSFRVLFVESPPPPSLVLQLFSALATPPSPPSCLLLASLIAILCMHLFWTRIFVRIALKLVAAKGGASQIAREEYHGHGDVGDLLNS